VVTLLNDFQGRVVRLTEERLVHIMKHAEMQGQEKLIVEALQEPDSIFLTYHDPSVHVYHKLFDKTPVTRKYLIVAVKYTENDAFIITAFFTNKERKGTRIWPQ